MWGSGMVHMLDIILCIYWLCGCCGAILRYGMMHLHSHVNFIVYAYVDLVMLTSSSSRVAEKVSLAFDWDSYWL